MFYLHERLLLSNTELLMKRIKQHIPFILLLIFMPELSFSADYKIAVRAHKGIEYAIKQWQPTVEILSKKIPQHTFTLLPVVSLKEITRRAGKGEFQFVLTNPSSFVELNQLYDAEALVTLNNKRANTAQSKFGSVIFTHVRHENILSIADLENNTLMAVSESAFGGWRVAWLEMLEKGFEPQKQLKKLLFAKSKTQPEVVAAVYEGIADAGVVRTDLLERLEAEGKIDMRYFRIIENKNIKTFPFFISTKLYPEWAFASMKSVSPEIQKEVKKILLDVRNTSEAAISGQYIGWIPPLDYSSVKNLMIKLKVGPFSSLSSSKRIAE